MSSKKGGSVRFGGSGVRVARICGRFKMLIWTLCLSACMNLAAAARPGRPTSPETHAGIAAIGPGRRVGPRTPCCGVANPKLALVLLLFIAVQDAPHRESAPYDGILLKKSLKHSGSTLRAAESLGKRRIVQCSKPGAAIMGHDNQLEYPRGD